MSSVINCSFCGQSTLVEKWFSHWCACERCARVLCSDCRRDPEKATYKHDEDGGWYECAECAATDGITTCQACGDMVTRYEIDPYLEKQFDKRLCSKCVDEIGRDIILQTLKEQI